jgi:hypothetical protein
MELQTDALVPALEFRESKRPVHQVRLLVDGDGKHGTLILDPNIPEFDDFGELMGGVQTPYARGKGGPLPRIELRCGIELVKGNDDRWLLFRIKDDKIATRVMIATRGPILDSGPARLLVLGNDRKVKAVISMSRYGIAVP